MAEVSTGRQSTRFSVTSSSALMIFFFNDTATTEIYTLSLHDALPISPYRSTGGWPSSLEQRSKSAGGRSEEHTSELQSQSNLVCRLLLEKKNKFTDSGMMQTRSESNRR